MIVVNRNIKLILILFISLIQYFLSNIFISNYLNFYSLLWLTLVSIYITKDKKYLWLFFPYIFGIFGGLIPSFVIEYKSYYLIEINKYTELTGVTSRASFLCSIFLISTYTIVRLLENNINFRLSRIRILSNSEFILFKIILFVCVFYLFLSLFVSGPPLFSNLPRFNYFHDGALPGYRFFYTLIPFFSLLLSISYISKLISLKNLIFLMIFLTLIPILTNEKFSLYMDIYFYFTIPLVCCGVIKVNKRFLAFFILFFTFMLSVVFIKYWREGQGIGYLLTRISLQAEMIYGLDAISDGIIKFDSSLIFNSFFGFARDRLDIGMYHLMQQLVSLDYVKTLADFNQSFTMPFPSNFTYFFTREFAPFFLIIYSIPIGYSIFIFYRAIISKSLFNAFIAATLYHYLSIATMMGKTERLVNLITIASFVIITCILLLSYYKNKNG